MAYVSLFGFGKGEPLKSTIGGIGVIGLQLVTQKDLAAVLSLTPKRIRDLHNEQGIFNTVDLTRKYSLPACVQEYIRYKVESENPVGGADLEMERAQHERVKKEISKLKLRKLRRELHDAADVEAVVGDMLGTFRGKLLSMPAKLAPQMIGMTDANDILKFLKQEVYEVLEALSEYNPDDYMDVGDNEAEDEESDSEDM